MSFMISRETENVQSLAEVVSSFRAITANGDRAYVTEDEIHQVWCMSIHYECLFNASYLYSHGSTEHAQKC